MEYRLPFKTILWILFLLQIEQQINCSLLETSSFVKNFRFKVPHTRVFFGLPKVLENVITLTHVQCNNVRDKCKVTQEDYLLDKPNSILSTKSCPFHFAYNDDLELIDIDVVQLNAERTIVVLKHQIHNIQSLKSVRQYYYVINTEKCKIHKIDERYALVFDPMDHIVPHPDGSRFDVFYTDFDVCNEGRVRKAYNDDGISIVEPLCVIGDEPNTKSALKKIGTDVVAISDDQYFLLDVTERTWMGFIVNFKGNKSQLITAAPKSSFSHRISTNQNRMTICWKPVIKSDTKIGCTYVQVYPLQAYLITFKFPYDLLTFEIHNLAYDKFLALTSPVEPRGKTLNESMANYDLWILKSDGSMNDKPTKVHGLSCGGPQQKLHVSIKEHGENEVCISFKCEYYITSEKKYFQFVTKCLHLQSEDDSFENFII